MSTPPDYKQPTGLRCDDSFRNRLNMQKMIERNIRYAGNQMPRKKRTQHIINKAKEQREQREKKLKKSDHEEKKSDYEDYIDEVEPSVESSPRSIVKLEATFESNNEVSSSTSSNPMCFLSDAKELTNGSTKDMTNGSTKDMTMDMTKDMTNDLTNKSTKESTKELTNKSTKELTRKTQSPFSKKDEQAKPSWSSCSKTNETTPISRCFSFEDNATSVDISPDGRNIVAGFDSGAVRLYDAMSTEPQDRHGYLMGHLDEHLSRPVFFSHLRVQISSNGRYCFVGSRVSPNVMMVVDLRHFRFKKDKCKDTEKVHKHFHQDSNLRGFGSVACSQKKDEMDKYVIACGLGVGKLRIWHFSIHQTTGEVRWDLVHHIPMNGNTLILAQLYIVEDRELVFAKCEDKDIRIWNLSEEGNPSHQDVPNSKRLTSVDGKYAYGNDLDQYYRLDMLSDEKSIESFDLAIEIPSTVVKSRRSRDVITGLSASFDGKHIALTTSSGGLVWSNQGYPLQLLNLWSNENERLVRIAQTLNPISRPTLVVADNGDGESEGFLWVSSIYQLSSSSTTNMTSLSSSTTTEEDQQHNHPPIERNSFSSSFPSFMIDSKELCWVCKDRSICHWEKEENGSKEKSSSSVALVKPVKEKKTSPRQTSLSTFFPIDGENPSSPTIMKVKKTAASTSAAFASAAPTSSTSFFLKSGATATVTPTFIATPTTSTKNRKRNSSGGRDDVHSNEEKMQELLMEYKKLEEELFAAQRRLKVITTEAERRLHAEIKLRREWNIKEASYKVSLEQELEKYKKLQDRLVIELESNELLREEIEHSKKERMEMKSNHLNQVAQFEKKLKECPQIKYNELVNGGSLALSWEQLSTIGKTLLEALKGNNNLKEKFLEKQTLSGECVICRDNVATNAVLPCGHLCFCENDAALYRVQSSSTKTCPVCLGENLSLVRIYRS